LVPHQNYLATPFKPEQGDHITATDYARGPSTMTILSFLRTFLYSQLFVTPPKVTQSFSGQTVIITGANVGLGLEAAKQIAALGCSRLILAVRTVSKGEVAKEEILKSTGRTDDFVEVWPLDLTKTESIKAFVARANALERIDVLLENAGIALTFWDEFEGMEQNIKVNVVSTMLIALSMLPKLRETAAKFNVTPHLEIVTSEAHKVTSYDEANEDDIFAKFADRSHYEKNGKSNPSR
jgi:retinol dehydrogenase 12